MKNPIIRPRSAPIDAQIIKFASTSVQPNDVIGPLSLAILTISTMKAVIIPRQMPTTMQIIIHFTIMAGFLPGVVDISFNQDKQNPAKHYIRLRNPADYLAVFVFREGAHGFGAYSAVRGGRETYPSHSLIVRCFAD